MKGLRFEVVNRYGGQALFLSNEKCHHHFAANKWNGIGALKPLENSVGLKSFTLFYVNEEARKEAIDNLQGFGLWLKKKIINLSLKILQEILLI